MYLVSLVFCFVWCCFVLFVLVLCLVHPMLPMSQDISILDCHSSSFKDICLYYLWLYLLLKSTPTTTNNWDIFWRVIKCGNYLRQAIVGFLRVLRFQPPWNSGNNNPNPFWHCYLCIQLDWTTNVFSWNRNIITYEDRCWNKNIYLIYIHVILCAWNRVKIQMLRHTRNMKPKPIRMSLTTCMSGFYGPW